MVFHPRMTRLYVFLKIFNMNHMLMITMSHLMNRKLEVIFVPTLFSILVSVISEDEIKVLEKGLDFLHIQRKVNEPGLTQYFEEFCWRMQTKSRFWHEPSDNFSEILAFRPKSSWKPPTEHRNSEEFLSSGEQELFRDIEIPLRYSNLSSEEWGAIRSLAHDRSIVLKKADKVSVAVVWDRDDYVKEIRLKRKTSVWVSE